MRILKLIRVLLAVTALLLGATSAHSQAVSGQGTWESTLQARDIGNTGTTNAFYDTVLGITWLRDANVNERMDWNTAMSWANNLTVGSVGGWRLPTIAANPNANYSYDGSTANGYNVPASSSEMANLFFSTLGNKSYYDVNGNGPQVGWGLSNTGSFQNLQAEGYWSDTVIAANPEAAWLFLTADGNQSIYYHQSTLVYAMAVHPGDVGTVVATIPEPETYAMLLAGLGLIGAVARRREARTRNSVR